MVSTKLEKIKYSSKKLTCTQFGGRKAAKALVSMAPHRSDFILINRKPIAEYFNHNNILIAKIYERFFMLKNLNDGYINESLEKYWNVLNHHYISIEVKGGGIQGQAEAIMLGMAKAFVDINPNLKPLLKPQKLLTRDARIKERRKYGLKKARRAPQFSKR